MKRTRLFVSVLLAVLLLAVSVAPAFAYTTATVGQNVNIGNGSAIQHSLQLTESPYDLLYTITYKFTVESGAIRSAGADASTVTGNPTIADATYTATDNFATASDHKVTKDVAVTWNGVSFSAPGTFYWKVNKTVDKGTAPETASNNETTLYLYAYVVDKNGSLEVEAIGLATNDGLTQKPTVNDTYPAKEYTFDLTKTVTGAGRNEDEYFPFEIKLTSVSNSANKTLSLSGFDPIDTVKAAPYNIDKTAESQPNSTITLTGNGAETTINVWLKHNQTFHITGIPHGTTYTITETNSDDFTASGEVKNAATIDHNITNTVTNSKNSTPPTGINLQTAAPVFGIVLVGLLMAVVLFSKRKQNENV